MTLALVLCSRVDNVEASLDTMILAEACKWLLYLTLPYLAYSTVVAVYNAFFGPLSSFPGPRVRALSSIPEVITLLKGEEAKVYPLLHREYGPVVRVGPARLSYTGPQAFKDIYGPKTQAQKDPFFYGKPHTGVNPIINADNATHSRQRRVLSLPFSGKSMRDLEPRLKGWVNRLVEKLSDRAHAGEPCDMVKLYNCLTFDAMGDFCFSEDLGMLSSGKYAAWLSATFEGIKTASRLVAIKMISSQVEALIDLLLETLPKFRGKEQMEHWDSSTARMRRRLAKTPEEPDMWSKILEKDVNGLSEGEHYANSAFFMFAGSETTATALSGVTYCVLKQPECLENLTKEIRETYSSVDEITLDSLARLEYLHAVLQEGLRMCPPVPSMLGRKVPSQGMVISGSYVPAGTAVGVHHLATYRSSEYWADPYEFHPERWLGELKYQNDRRDAFEPFSVGQRDCLGKALAWHEIRLVIATVLFKFDLELCFQSRSWMDELKIYGLWEKKPLICRLRRRNF